MSIREKVELDSKKMRETGNLRFKEKKFEKALEAYSQAALGPGPTTDKALALANRSGNLPNRLETRQLWALDPPPTKRWHW